MNRMRVVTVVPCLGDVEGRVAQGDGDKDRPRSEE